MNKVIDGVVRHDAVFDGEVDAIHAKKARVTAPISLADVRAEGQAADARNRAVRQHNARLSGVRRKFAELK
jgi:hypothetical protein